MDRRRLAGLIALIPVGTALLPGAARAAGKKKDEPATRSPYVPIQTLLGTTVRPDGRRGSLSVECGLDIPDASLRERAEASMPRLRSAFAATVRTYAAGLPAGHPPNVHFIARALQQQTDQVLGRAGAKVLLGAVLVN